jgi:hypothetical protein
MEDVRDVAVEEVGLVLSAEDQMAEVLELLDVAVAEALHALQIEQARQLAGVEPQAVAREAEEL